MPPSFHPRERLSALVLLALLAAPQPRPALAQAACSSPLVADLARGTFGGVRAGAALNTWRARLGCLRRDSVQGGALVLPRPAGQTAGTPDPQARVDAGGWTLYAGFGGTVRPAVLGLPMRTAVARLRRSGLRVAFVLGDDDPAYALRTRTGCLVLYAEDGRVAQVQVSPRRCERP